MEDLKTYHNELETLRLSQATVYEAPIFKDVKNKDWVPYLDMDKTQYPDKLIFYKNNSSLHGAIINSMADQVAGNGFEIEEDEKTEETKEFLDTLSSKGDDANEFLSKIADDLVTFKGFAILVKWNTTGDKIIKMDHLDFSKVRSGKVNELGVIEDYFYAYDWNTQRPNYIIIPAYNKEKMSTKKKKYNKAIEKALESGEVVPEIRDIFNEPTEQILYCHPYASNEFFYPLPYYVAAINSINTDILTDQYGLGMMDNGLSSNHIINFKGNYTPEQKKEEARSFVRSYINGVKKSRPVITFSKDADSGIDITPIGTNGKDQKYTDINENVTQKILSGHGVTSPMLVGIREAGSLGGAQELEVAASLFYRNTIRPKQNTILKVMNDLLKVNELSAVKITRLSLLSESTEIESETKTTEEEIIK